MSEASVQMLSAILERAGGFNALPRLLSTALSSTAMLSASSQPLCMVSAELHKCQGLGGGLTAGEVIIQVLPAGEEAENGGRIGARVKEMAEMSGSVPLPRGKRSLPLKADVSLLSALTSQRSCYG
ncbi:hypothetical protein AOLI_G00016090 [Acnodon oligacanthus]